MNSSVRQSGYICAAFKTNIVSYSNLQGHTKADSTPYTAVIAAGFARDETTQVNGHIISLLAHSEWDRRKAFNVQSFMLGKTLIVPHHSHTKQAPGSYPKNANQKKSLKKAGFLVFIGTADRLYCGL